MPRVPAGHGGGSLAVMRATITRRPAFFALTASVALSWIDSAQVDLAAALHDTGTATSLCLATTRATVEALGVGGLAIVSAAAAPEIVSEAATTKSPKVMREP